MKTELVTVKIYQRNCITYLCFSVAMFHTPRGVQLCSENPSKQCDTCMCMLDTETDGSTL